MLPPNFPSDSSQKKIIKSFKKIGWEILPFHYGKGSHIQVKEPKTGFIQNVQHKIFREVIKTYLKRIDELGYDVNEFIKYL